MNAIMTIAGEVARIRGVALKDILSRRKSQTLVRPRQEAMYLGRHLTPDSLPDIGRVLRRDHTTVLHSVRKIEGLIATVPGYATDIEAMESVVREALGKFRVPLRPTAEMEDRAAEIEAIITTVRSAATVGIERALAPHAKEIQALRGSVEAMVRRLAALERQLHPITAHSAASAGLVKAARLVVAAAAKRDAEQFTPQERWSQKALDHALDTLKSTLDEKDATQ